MLRLRSSREWISRDGPGARRKTTFVFGLSKATLVEFVIVRVAPDCRRIGSFRLQGHPGTNKVQFRGRYKGKPLAEGTYVIRAQALRGRRVLQTTIVIFDKRPAPGDVAAAKASNACSSSEAFGSSAGGYSSESAATSGSNRSGAGSEPSSGSGRADSGRDRGGSGVLGVRFSRAADAVSEVHPLLFVILGLAIMLLALAALPLRWVPNARVAAVLAYRRSLVALAGATALVAVAVAYALA